VIGLALALGFCIEMSLQTSYAADLAAIVNSNSAFVLGGVVALLVTQTMRVVGTQASARRLIRATHRDLADLAAGRSHPDRDQWTSRMMDRVALLLYRQPRFEPQPQHEFADALEDLRLGVNMIETQSIAPIMSKSAQDALAAMFASLAAHFRGTGAWPRGAAWRRFVAKNRYCDRRSDGYHCKHACQRRRNRRYEADPLPRRASVSAEGRRAD
jgi:uncharacterized membrane protein YccC